MSLEVKAVTKERVEKISKNELKQQLKEEAVKLYEEKEAEFPEEEQIRELERVVLLKVIDQKWMDHIDDMDQLREGIGLQAYGQRDPKVEYKMAAYDMFNEMLESIQQDTVRLLFHVRVEQKVEREQVAKVTGTNKDESGPRKQSVRSIQTIHARAEAARSINSAAEENRFDKSRTAVRRMSTIRLTKHAASLPEAACHTKYKTESR